MQDTSEIGSIITELDLDTITMEMEKPVDTPPEVPLAETTPTQVSDVLRQVQDAPLKEEITEPVNPAEQTITPPETPPVETPEPAETPPETPEPTEPTEPTEPNVYASFAKAVYEEGVFSEFDEKEFTELTKELGSPAKALIELNKRTIQHYVDTQIQSYPEEIRKLAENYQEGVPLDELIQVQSDTRRLENITDDQLLDNTDLRKQLIVQDLMNRGFTESEAGEEHKLYVESAIDDKRAVQAKDRLISRQEEVLKTKADEAKTAKDTRLKAIEDSRKNLKDQVDGAKQFIPGVDVSNREKSLVFNALTKPVARDARGNELNEIMMTRAKNPVHFDTMVAYLYTKGVFNVDDKGVPAPKTEELFKGKKSETIADLEKQMNNFNGQFREQGSSVAIEKDQSLSGDHMIKHLNF